jgi:translation initiation factor 2 subunit 1
MIYKKTGLPEDSEIVMCTVTKIQYSSVFVKIDEYGISGMIHISEIAAGRIRNIRDYVKEGKKVCCKVLRIHRDKGHVDLSLRRVTDSQRRNKVNQLKMEQKAESILEYVAKQNKLDFKKIYLDFSVPILKEYEYIHHAFEDVVAKECDLLKIVKADKKVLDQVIDLVNVRFKPQEIEITGVLKLTTYEGNGVEVVRDALKKAQEVKGADIRYLGGGKYKFTVQALEYKEAEPILKEAVDTAINYIQKHNGVGEFTRTKAKS